MISEITLDPIIENCVHMEDKQIEQITQSEEIIKQKKKRNTKKKEDK